MVNAIPVQNLPVPNFAYHLPKSWTDRFAHVNDKLPKNSMKKDQNSFLLCYDFVLKSRSSCLSRFIESRILFCCIQKCYKQATSAKYKIKLKQDNSSVLKRYIQEKIRLPSKNQLTWGANEGFPFFSLYIK